MPEAILLLVDVGSRRRILIILQDLIDIQLLHIISRNTERVKRRLAKVAPVSIDRGVTIHYLRRVMMVDGEPRLRGVEAFARIAACLVAELAHEVVREGVRVGL